MTTLLACGILVSREVADVIQIYDEDLHKISCVKDGVDRVIIGSNLLGDGELYPAAYLTRAIDSLRNKLRAVLGLKVTDDNFYVFMQRTC